MNNIRAANVRANLECDFEASFCRENKFCILLMLADKIFTCVAPIVSVRVQALLATSILSNARESVGRGSVFSLSFSTFLSLYLANKEKEKYILL